MQPVTRRLLWLALSAATLGVATLTRNASAQVSGYRVESFTIHDGLPSQAITDVTETSDGYLWIAAGGILARFDGYLFRAYTQANTPSLVRRVHHLHAGIGDTLWILDEGNAVFAHAGGTVVPILPPSDFDLDGLIQDGDGTLYGLGSGSVWRLHRGGGTHSEVLPRISLGVTRIRSGRNGSGRAWIVDSNAVLRELGANARRSRRTLFPAAVATSRSTGELYTLSARGGLRDVVRATGDVVTSFAEAGTYFPAILDRDGRLWVVSAATYDVFERGRTEPVARIPSPEPGAAGMLFEGESGCVWVTETVLMKACRVPFSTIPLSITPRQFITRGPDGAGMTWDADSQVVALTATGDTRRLARVRQGMSVARAHVDVRNTIWWSISSAMPDDTGLRLLPRAGAYAFAEDRRSGGSLWYATAHQVLYRVTIPTSGRSEVLDSVVAHGVVTAMTVSSDGTLWATLKRPDLRSEVLRVADGQPTTLSSGEGFPTAALRAIKADDDGTVWLGTYGGGLLRYRDGRFGTVTEEQGLGENVVTSLLEDDAGNLWMGGNRSVHRVAKRDVHAVLDGAAARVRGVVYGRADGLLSPETTGYPGFRDDSGRFWFPTITGAAVVDPALALSLDSAPPRVHILALQTARDTVEGGKLGTARLTRGNRRLTIAYTGIAMRNSPAVQYEYRIDGVDTDWISAGTARTAIYNNVNPGTHTFRVRAINGGGVSSVADATLTFTVPHLFYETPVFLAVLLLSAASLAWAGVNYRERRARRRVAWLEQAVDERTATLATALSTVAAQADQLRTLDEAKSRFFANVSHEFRTPLSLIIGPVDDLREGRSGELSPIVRRRLEGVQSNANRLLQLVEQILDVARLESGTLHLSAEVRDLLPLLRRMADSFSSLAERRGIRFRLSCPVGGLRVRYDPDQMEKVVSNLVGNALKFTPGGGEVELRATAEPDGDGGGLAVIEVQDTGPGIAAEFHARVFERFFQVDDSSRRAHEGTGIGLALVRELVELHGGTVTLRSALGEGSTFTLRLPLATGTGAVSAEHLAHAPDHGRVEQRASAIPAPARLSAAPDATTVLVIEDNAELLEFLRDHLAERYRVLVAENGLRGLEMARAHVPDLIVSDVMMPGMDGQALCEAVKHDAEIDFIPVILLTAKASRDSRLAGLAGGADDYLTKPVDLPELLIRADNLIASRRRVRERWHAADRQLPSINVPVKAPPRDASARALLEKLSRVLADHLADEEFTVEAMAAAMGMGRSTMYRRLEPWLGMSPMDALWEYRLAQAAQWLAETAITVSEVAYGVGFKSVPHFCGKFRERYGETPSGYRRVRRVAAAT
ncbi:MAG: response regulator [Gemmatimonadetes bacterium]|nr:response regulator [Gemmatimonadota bacterium]